MSSLQLVHLLRDLKGIARSRMRVQKKGRSFFRPLEAGILSEERTGLKEEGRAEEVKSFRNGTLLANHSWVHAIDNVQTPCDSMDSLL